MIKFYISEGLLIATVIGCLIANRQNKRKISELKAEVDSMKKERIDDWVDTASDILEGQQDAIDGLEEDVIDLNTHVRYIDKDIDEFEDDIKEIKEILEKTVGVKFNKDKED